VVSEQWDLEVLGAILISKIGQSFIEAYGVRMRGGTLRFQSQYLKKIRVPDPQSITPETQGRLKRAFRSRNIQDATSAAVEAYGIDASKFGL
jgi:hypothetical protein